MLKGNANYFSSLMAASTTPIILALSLVMTGCSSSKETLKNDAGRSYKLTILHTNDHHGRFWKNEQGEWGMAARKTLIDQIRTEVEAEGGEVLLLSGGDINSGVPESDLQSAVPDIEGMNLMGYDAMVVGNHEFDNPMKVLHQQENLANFPFLSANTYDASTGRPLFDAFRLMDVGNMTVAVVGLTTQDTRKIGNPDNVSRIDFKNPLRIARRLVPKIQEQVDVVIALTHLGYFPEQQSANAPPGDIELATEVRGIDMIIGAHSRTALYQPEVVNNTWIMQAGENGKYLGRADFTLKDGQLTLEKYELIPINHKNQTPRIEEDPEMLNLLAPYQKKGQELTMKASGVVDQRFEGERKEIRSRPTNLGVLVASSMMKKTYADFAVINSGSIRASLPSGPVSYRDILTVKPYNNFLAYANMTGREVRKYLQKVVNLPAKTGAFAQFAGLEMTIKGNNVSNIKIQGRPLRNNRKYRMAVNDFLAAGGDGYPVLEKHPGYVVTGYGTAEVLRWFIKTQSPIKAENFAPVGILRY
ncbi:MAG: bifunctional UDP-sugar hydrolase/5'-nucleotidase UshA [Endozoicomonas sp.]|uniref:bifunctional UDP-sugar hydrolase/5'-nucleotidase UshA n=1 Tax=Endozoicomonas sp. TaxID=1892382 RepID=UPI003D9BB458